MKYLFSIKHILVAALLISARTTFTQPRAQEESVPQPPIKELAAYVQYLQQTGQLPNPQENKEEKEKRDASTKDPGNEEKKFQDATTGILAGMFAVISGATSGDPLQIASGIFTMFGAAFLAATRSKIQDDEMAPRHTRSRTRIHETQDYRDRIESFMRHQVPPAKKR